MNKEKFQSECVFVVRFIVFSLVSMYICSLSRIFAPEYQTQNQNYGYPEFVKNEISSRANFMSYFSVGVDLIDLTNLSFKQSVSNSTIHLINSCDSFFFLFNLETY